MIKFTQMSIGMKLSIISAAGIAMVAVMVSTNIYSGMASLSHAEKEGRQIDIVAHLTTAKVDLREMQMASRDMRLAKSSEEAEQAFAVEKAGYEELAVSMAGAEALMGLPENIEQAKKGQEAAQAYLVQSESLLKVLTAQMALSATPTVDGAPLAAERAQIEAEMRTAAGEVVALIEEIAGRADTLAEEAAKQTTAEISQGQLIGTLMGAFVILTLICFAIFGAKSIAKPISAITAGMSRLARGDLEAAIPYVGRADEIGDMAAAVQVFKENGIKVAAMNQDEAERARLTAERAQMMEHFQGRFTEVVEAAAEGDFSRRIRAMPS